MNKNTIVLVATFTFSAPAHFGSSSPAAIAGGALLFAAIPNELGLTVHDSAPYFKWGWDWQIPLSDPGNSKMRHKLPLSLGRDQGQWSYGLGYRMNRGLIVAGMQLIHRVQRWSFAPEIGVSKCLEPSEKMFCAHLIYQFEDIQRHSAKILLSLY